MKTQISSLLLLGFSSIAMAQSSQIREANKLYKEGKFDEAVALYEEALRKTPGDLTAMYNRSNALAKKGDKAAAMEGYEQIIREGKDPRLVEKAYYDKGVLHQQQQQLDESIAAWMESLKMDPDDKEARENLQKALREKKEKEQKEQKEDKEKEDKEKDKEKEKDKDKEKKPQQSKLNKKQVEQLLKALEQKEKEVQKKMQQKSGSPTRPEKDW